MFKSKIIYIFLIFFVVIGVYMMVPEPTQLSSKKDLHKSSVLKEVDLAKKLSTETKSGLLLKSGLAELPKEKQKTLQKTSSVELDFFRLLDDETLVSESGFGQTYKKIESFKISDEVGAHEITFKEEVNDVASVVILVDEGAIDLKSFTLNGKSETEQGKQYFKGDWIKREPSKSLKKVQFSANPLTESQATVSLYIQYLGD